MVRNALQGNSEILIVGDTEANHLPDKFWYWSHTVNICIAPKIPLYKAEELQLFMLSLITEVVPSDIDGFRSSEYGLRLGVLYFDEDIGTQKLVVHKEMVLTDESLFSSPGFTKGVLVSDVTTEVSLLRRTWVRLFPDSHHAKNAMSGVNEYQIPVRDFVVHQDLGTRIARWISQ
jgi:hypothetical protein